MAKKKQREKRPGASARSFQGIGPNFGIHKKVGGEADISREHKKIMREVNEDVADMIEYRKPAIITAEEAIQGYMALAMDGKPGRSKFFPPVLHAIVWSAMAINAAHKPKVVLKHRLARSEPLMKFLNAAIENAENGDGDKRPPSEFAFYQQSFDQILFGVGFRHLTYLLQKVKRHVKDDRGRWVEREIVEYDDIWDEHLSFFHTGVSRDTLPGMFGGSSAYNDKFYRRDAFAAMFRGNPNYFNIDLALAKIQGPFIRFRRYWGLHQDMFFVQAMDADDDQSEDTGEGVPIRLDHILEYGPDHRVRKMIPISSTHGEFSFDMRASDIPNFTQDARSYTEIASASNRQTFWTKGKGLIAKGCIGINRSIHRATHDNMKASTVFFAMSQNPGVLNQIKRAEMYGMVPLKADERSFNVKALIERNQAFAGIPEYLTAVNDLAKAALGDDWEQSAGELTNEKATVAAIREQVKRTRAKQIQGMQESGPIHRHYLLLTNLVQQFYPEKTEIAVRGAKELPEDIEEVDIVRDPSGAVVGYKRMKKIAFKEPVVVERKDGRISVRHDEEEGDKLVPAEHDLIVSEEEPEIYIKPGSTFEENQAIARAMNLEKMQGYQFYMGLAYPDENGQPQPLIPKSGAEYLLRESAEIQGDDPEEVLGRKTGEDDPRPRLKRAYAGSGGEPGASNSQIPMQTVTPTPAAGGGSPMDALSSGASPLARAMKTGA